MEIKGVETDGRFKVIGTDGHTKISVAPPTSVRVQVGDQTMVIPMDLVLALQTEAAIEFMKDPAVVPYMYAANDRESRLRAAILLARKETGRLRRDFVAQIQPFVATIGEAWDLARIKFPDLF